MLNELPMVSARSPRGAFYVMANFEKYLGQTIRGRLIKDSFDLAEYLLDEARVGVVPGSAFGVKGFVRFSYATSIQNIEEGVARIRTALA